jgi:cell division septum initiation protein DivIVA
MDILHLVDRLEELFNESRPFPLTHNVIVDEDRFLDIIDQMRISIPEEVKKAQQVHSQKDRVLAQAQEEANRTLAIAREKADALVEKENVAQEAQKRAGQIVEQARMEAENIKAGADQYALDSLLSLETELQRILQQVRNGIQVLEEKKAARGAPPAQN